MAQVVFNLPGVVTKGVDVVNKGIQRVGDVVFSRSTAKKEEKEISSQTLEGRFASEDFDASLFVRQMYDGSLDEGKATSAEETKPNNSRQLFLFRRKNSDKQKNYTIARKNVSLDLHNEMNTPTREHVEYIRERKMKQIKKKITDKYQVFITAAQDTRDLTELVRRQNEQVNKYEATLELIKHGHASEVSLSNGTNNLNMRRPRPSIAFGTEAEGKSNAEQNNENDDGENKEKEKATEEEESVEEQEYSQLDVLIIQRRMEEATEEARVLIHKHRQRPPKDWLRLNIRLDKLNNLILRALDRMPLEDRQWQLSLVTMTSYILRSKYGCGRLLILRSQLIQTRLRRIVLESASTSTDHIGTSYTRSVCRTVCGIVSSTSYDFRAAFSSSIEWTNILCALISWIKRDCIDCILRMLGNGPYNSLAGEHQEHTTDMYLQPLSRAATFAATSFSTANKHRRMRSEDIGHVLTHGCFGATAIFDTERLATLVTLVQCAVSECEEASTSTGVPMSTCISKSLLSKHIHPSIREHCRAFHNFIRVSSGCGMDVGFQTFERSGKKAFHIESMSMLRQENDVSMTLSATAASLRCGALSFLDAVGDYATTMDGPLHVAHTSMSNTSRWFCMMVMHQSDLYGVSASKVLESFQFVSEIATKLKAVLFHMDVQAGVQHHDARTRVAFGNFQLELGNTLAHLQRSAAKKEPDLKRTTKQDKKRTTEHLTTAELVELGAEVVEVEELDLLNSSSSSSSSRSSLLSGSGEWL